MANLILVMGKSGTGKSTAIRTLDPTKTLIISVLDKILPFKGAKKLYNKENKNLYRISNYNSVMMYIKGASDKLKNVTNIIIDDATYLMRNELFEKSNQKGYDKFVEIAKNFRNLLILIPSLRDDINVFLIMHSEDVNNGSDIDSYKCSTVGKMVDEKFNPLECVTVCLYSDIKFNSGTPEYGFYTNATQVHGKLIPAKSPDGMFDELFVPNDFKLISEKINEYYN